MDRYEKLKLVAFVGLAGSGKSSAVKYLTEKSIPKVYFGGVILNGMKAAGIEQTPENEEKYRDDLRLQNGPDFVSKEIIKEIDNLYDAGQHRVVADGLYSWSEYKLFKETFHHHITVVAIFCPRHTRHHRLEIRKERPFNESEASERDYDEIEHLEKGGPIAMADYMVINDKGYDDFHKQIDKVLTNIDF